MTTYAIKTLIGFACFAVSIYASPIANINNILLHLRPVGYTKESASLESLTNKYQEVSTSIKNFPIFSGPDETGELDHEKLAKMSVIRRGLNNKVIHSESSRQKRYILDGGKWHKTELTYHIRSYPSSVEDEAGVRKVIARAFKVWSNVTPLQFRETMSEGTADIVIRFESGDHGDGSPFDGSGEDLAHSNHPVDGGDICFDDDENWTLEKQSGFISFFRQLWNPSVDLFQIAVHEIGHSLGLDDSDEKQAMMSPYFDKNFYQLQSDDIEGIQELYGARRPSRDEDAGDDYEGDDDEGDYYK